MKSSQWQRYLFSWSLFFAVSLLYENVQLYVFSCDNGSFKNAFFFSRKSDCLMAVFQGKSLCTRVTKVAKIVSPLSIYSYIKQVQYFLPLPSSVGCPLSQTKELDTLNWSLWWIAFEVRSLYRYTGFIPAQPSSQHWIDGSNLWED